MSFDKQQPSYVRLRDVLAVRSNQVIVWGGSGLSAEANLPTWDLLAKELIRIGDQKASSLANDAKQKLTAEMQLAKLEDNYWKKFSIIKAALGDATYRATVGAIFAPAYSADLPTTYLQLWKQLPISGFISLNIDGLVDRAYHASYPGAYIRQFTGSEIGGHGSTLQDGRPFIAHLHGRIDNPLSWVFTQEEFDCLQRDPAYKIFLQTCFTSRVVVFCGISADDSAVGGHLRKLVDLKISLGSHFWITDRNDAATVSWAESAGIQLIHYSGANHHRQFLDLIGDLKTYTPKDEFLPPIIPPTRHGRHFVLPSPAELLKLPANQIRNFLNKEAERILASSMHDKISQYGAFIANYEEAIHRSWYVSTSEGGNEFFDHSIASPIASGGFGKVFKAVGPDGKTVALKLLHGAAHTNGAMLESFRRGVHSMSILSANKIKGTVPYIKAWELPTSVIMEFVDGGNIEDAVKAGLLTSWEDRLTLIQSLASILKSAHGLKEQVLHRDVRPANIMVREVYANPMIAPESIVVLDFDLSWHKEATGVSVNLSHTMNGYLAPEQVADELKRLRRSALVDSFGFGMTVFFLLTRQHPLFGQQQHKDWSSIIRQKIGGQKCEAWRSIPNRLARLVYFSTLHQQAERWDMTRLLGEATLLREALKHPEMVASRELIAEELLCRVSSLKDIYQWDVQRNLGKVELKEGFEIQCTGDDSAGKIRLNISWMHSGNSDFQSVKKYVPECTKRAAAKLQTAGWKIDEASIVYDSSHISAFVDAGQSGLDLNKRADGIAGAIEMLRLLH